ncbi:MAG: uracil-DNA glycosylase, partial [Phycisphaerae bacterium]|nr:uracil-DNA glycosylase [Saprospiraceae bacterium]
MLPPIPAGWKAQLSDETKKPYYRELDAFLDQELAGGQTVLPAREDIFNALKFTPYDQVKVLLLGQDPYPNPRYAHGLCFSVQPHVQPLPGSLKNVYKELHDDVGFRIPNNGYLESWARQGILMLNTLLTLQAGVPNSHQKKGWEKFTDRIIELVAAKPTRVVFLLWGASAQKKGKLVNQPQHKVINCAHPSQLSASKFFGCRCFSKTNQHLDEAG